MTDIARIEDFLSSNLQVDLNSPVSYDDFSRYMSALGRNQLDTRISDELFSQMNAMRNPPTMKEFAPVFIEAVRRLDGKIAQSAQNAATFDRLSQQPPAVTVPSDSAPKFAFRPMEIDGLTIENPTFEFSQGGAVSSASFGDFRAGDAILSGVNTSQPLQVSINNPFSGRREAGFALNLANFADGRKSVTEDIADSGRQVSVLYQGHLFRNGSEYTQQLAQSFREMKTQEEGIRSQLSQMRSNIQVLFPGNVVNYGSLQPLMLDSASELNNNYNFPNTAKILNMGGGGFSAVGQSAGPSALVANTNVYSSGTNFNQPMTTATTVTTSNYGAQPASLNFGALPTEPAFAQLPMSTPAEQPLSFGTTEPRPPMNLSPFQQNMTGSQTFGNAALGTAGALGAAGALGTAGSMGGGLSPFTGGFGAPVGPAGSYQSPYGSFNARWNPTLMMIRNLAFGLFLLSLYSCFSRCAFLPLIASLFFLIWFEFRDDHDLHVPVDYFLVAFGVALIMELVWLFTQSSYYWGQDYHLNDRSHSWTDKLVVLCGWVMLGLLGGILYFLRQVRSEGIYMEALGGKPETVRKPALSLML